MDSSAFSRLVMVRKMDSPLPPPPAALDEPSARRLAEAPSARRLLVPSVRRVLVPFTLPSDADATVPLARAFDSVFFGGALAVEDVVCVVLLAVGMPDEAAGAERTELDVGTRVVAAAALGWLLLVVVALLLLGSVLRELTAAALEVGEAADVVGAGVS